MNRVHYLPSGRNRRRADLTTDERVTRLARYGLLAIIGVLAWAWVLNRL